MAVTKVDTEKLTPAMRQFHEVKETHPGCVVFFRMGDFYEMFHDDAVAASRVLGIALTSRDKEKKIPMCGVPYHAAAGYIARLVRHGHRVAVCDQVEDPRTAKGVVKREVTRVITPGVAFEDELLEPGANNYIAAAYLDGPASGFALMDASTGEFRVTELKSRDELFDEIRRMRPLELVVHENQRENFDDDLGVKQVTPMARYDFTPQAANERLTEQFEISSLDGLGCGDLPRGVRAAGALLGYIRDTQKSALKHLKKLTPYHTGDYLVMDSRTRRNLDITENSMTGGREGTLLKLLDRTDTAMGSRCLKSWLLHPLKDVDAIRARQEAVGELMEDRAGSERLRGLLSRVYDLERLITRVSLGSAGPRDLVSLKDSLSVVPEAREALEGFSSGQLTDTAAALDDVPEARDLIERGIDPEPPVGLRDGGVVREGYNPDLDELRSIGAGGKDTIARMEATERERTGISSLKVGYNKVFGYYIEVTKTHQDSVPDDYIRKQTLVAAERFITPALKEWEEKILTAEEKARELEAHLFAGIRGEVSRRTRRIQQTAEALASLDTLLSLAHASLTLGYTRPEVTGGDELVIEGGRHPVIEASLPGEFVPNDLVMDPAETQVMVLTGPNMAGKSTYLRQNALVVLMAQIGSYVPASRAAVGVMDRVFTRIGASDDLSRGQSTFMVEMNETANILNNATPRSLIILDEIGRGTSTFDGLSIAWAVVEYLHDADMLAGRTRTLFATHYHELTELSLTKERVKNYNMAVKQWDDRVIFLRKVVPGGCSSSYGIEVARLAGLPKEVTERAGEILANLETGELTSSGLPRLARHHDADGEDAVAQMNLLGRAEGEGTAAEDGIADDIRGVDLDRTTPIEALKILAGLKERLED